MKRLLIILVALTAFAAEDGRLVPGKDYFPISASDWAYMAKYHESFSVEQKTRAAYQAIAMKLSITDKILAVSNNEGRFWENCWKSWANNKTENNRVLDVILNYIDSMPTPEIKKSYTRQPHIYRLNSSW